jgi:hypothetical protein
MGTMPSVHRISQASFRAWIHKHAYNQIQKDAMNMAKVIDTALNVRKKQSRMSTRMQVWQQ